jgi:uncharacterized protein
MMIVLDTNVLVSGLLSPFGPSGAVLRLVSSGGLILLTDARILSEYAEVLRRPKFRFDEKAAVPLLDYLDHCEITVAGSPLAASLPDASDDMFLEAAIAGRASCIVTGNLKHFPAALCRGMSVKAPRGFLTFYGRQSE